MTLHGDSLLAERLSALEDPRDDSNWDDVLRRAVGRPLEQSGRFRGRRTLLIAAVVAVLMLTLGVALAATLGGFSGWLSGKPGSRASSTEQQAFQRVNARLWASFPSGTKLRRLIVTRRDGSTFRLFGFRSGDEICLRLTVNGDNLKARMSCYSRLQLINAKVPAAVAVIDIPAGKACSVLTGRRTGLRKQRVRIASNLVSYGVVADGVSKVEFRIRKHNDPALVQNNTFLLVRRNAYSRKSVGQTTAIHAIDAAGERIDIAFACVICDPMRMFSQGKTRFGPTRIDRKPPRRTIAWLNNHEPRGLSLREAGITNPKRWLEGHHPVQFVRVIQPDPRNHVRVIIWLSKLRSIRMSKQHKIVRSRWHKVICTSTITGARGGGFGCGSGLAGFPLAVGEGFGSSYDQLALISGLASDAVFRIDLFLNDGERWTVPLKDNAFATVAPRTGFPAKLVGYDSQGKVVAIQDLTAL